MATTSIGAPGVVFPDGTTQAGAANPNVIVTIYTSPATWTKPPTVKFVKVTVVGGGASGQKNNPGSLGPLYAGSSGGSGIAYLPGPSIPSPQPITIGSGGAAPPDTGSYQSGNSGTDTSFGTFVTAGGGVAGTCGAPGTFPGAGGSFTNSPTVLGLVGNPSIKSLGSPTSYIALGQGGQTTGVGYGQGGGSGAAGAPGIVIVEEFY